MLILRVLAQYQCIAYFGTFVERICEMKLLFECT